MLSTLHTLPGYPMNGETRSSSAKKAKGPVRPASSVTPLRALHIAHVAFFSPAVYTTPFSIRGFLQDV